MIPITSDINTLHNMLFVCFICGANNLQYLYLDLFQGCTSC